MRDHPQACDGEDGQSHGEAFVATRSFAGPKHGFVFKLGPQGAGYYRDTPPTLSLFDHLFPPDHLAPLRISIFDALGLALNPPSQADAPLHLSPRRMRRRYRGGRGRNASRRGHMACVPTDIVHQADPRDAPCDPLTEADTTDDDDEVDCKDAQHRSAGLWAIDTLNPNSWNKAVDYLRRSAADFSLIQETRTFPGADTTRAEGAARSLKWNVAIQPALVTAAESTSGGTAVGAKSHIGIAPPCHPPPYTLGGASGRFSCQHVGAMLRGGLHLASIWLFPTVGIGARCNLDFLQEVGGYLRSLRAPWILGGDFNGEPEELQASGWLNLVDGQIVCAALPTCNGSRYDYFVVARCLLHGVVGATRVRDGDMSPHSPVRLLMRANPRTILVRCLRAHRPLEAVLPHGPITEEAARASKAEGIATSRAADFDLHEEYAKWLGSAEQQLASIDGRHLKGDGHGRTRVDGPEFVWKVACGSPADDPVAVSGVARAWSLTARWLSRMLRVPSSTRCWKKAWWNVRFYRHDWGKSRADDYLDDVMGFLAWRDALPTLSTPPAHAVQAFATAATANAASFVAKTQRQRMNSWTTWLHEGPAAGLRRQHRMSRVASGWIPAPVGDAPDPTLSYADDVDEVHDKLDDAWPSGGRGRLGPLDAQSIAEREKADWAEQWAASAPYPLLPWPDDLGPLLPPIAVDLFRQVLATFAAHTALGWDALHPRALLRLSDCMLLALLRIIAVAEARGCWPAAVALVLVVLLPKPDGGRRPIGLLPLLPRIWARARRPILAAWERTCDRPYLYAGPARGAQVATWRQAARAELASAVGVEYAQTLLDLVKAFERIPHHVLVREAVRLGYPLLILRLSLATYRLARALRVDSFVSSLTWATRGVTAGSAHATSEMRLLVIHIVDTAIRSYPLTRFTVYVDDISAEIAATRRLVMQNIGAATACVCRLLQQNGAEISSTKSFCTASTDAIGTAVAEQLKEFGFGYRRRVKSLGAALGAGVRRNASVARSRLSSFCKRLGLFRRLRRARVNTARLLRTGGAASMTYDSASMGISCSLLANQRRAAAAAAAPVAGTSGQSVDITFALEHAVHRVDADPAVVAHTGPIGQWAMAAWDSWLPRSAMLRLAAHARRRLTTARNLWATVTGPGAAFVASASRLRWIVHDAFSVTTDAGVPLRFDIDPPAVVVKEVAASVARWRWRRVELLCPHLESAGRGLGADLMPIAKLLRSREKSDVWYPAARSGLRSVIVGRQWTQARLFAAGLASHNRCCLCLYRALIGGGLTDEQAATVMRLLAALPNPGTTALRGPLDVGDLLDRLQQHQADALEQAMVEIHSVRQPLVDAPIGPLVHRTWACPALEQQRAQLAPHEYLQKVLSGDPPNLTEATRALFPSQLGLIPPPPATRPLNG